MPYVEYADAGAACSECGRLFPDEETLAAHKKESHEVPDVTSRIPPARRPRSPRRGP